MKAPRDTWPYLVGFLMGAGLFWLGWSKVEKAGTPFVDQAITTLVVRPVLAETGWDGAVVKDPDSSAPLGVRYAPSGAKQLTAVRPSWGDKQADNAAPGELRTIRLNPPLAKLDPRTADGSPVSLSILPEKSTQDRQDGYVRVPPGRYKFLATAEGHLPDAVEVDLSPGEVKKLTVELKKIPAPPKTPAPPPVSQPAVSEAPPPLPSYPSPPVYQPRPQPRPRPRPQPQTRFTPVAPARPVQPAPVFTPFP